MKRGKIITDFEKNKSNHEKKAHEIDEGKNVKKIREEMDQYNHRFFHDDYDGVPMVWAFVRSILHLHQMEPRFGKNKMGISS